ncbi:MAG TPA: hypothetical protein VF136_02055 [Methylomirabilota bacterium]
MRLLILVVWAVYLTEALVRWRAGGWVFKGYRPGALRPVEGADVELLDGRVGLVLLPLFPWEFAFRAAGEDWTTGPTRARLADVERAVVPVGIAATLLFGCLLPVPTALIFSGHLLPLLWPWLIASGIAWAATLLLFFTTYRRVHDAWPSAETTAMALLSPLALTRAPFWIQGPAIEAAHPLAAAAVLCDDRVFSRLARRWQFDHPEDAERVAALAAERGIAPGSLTAAPALQPDLTKFCPRCHQGYVEAAAVCADCGGVELAALR